MQTHTTSIPEILIFEPKVFGDERGFFFESFNQQKFNELTGNNHPFVQDNHSRSAKNVLRGLHYQIQQPQGKLVRVVSGAVFDVAVDIRRSSATFGKWVGVHLSLKTNGNCGSRQGLRMVFSYLASMQNFFIKQRIIGRPSTNAPYVGMTRK